MHLPEGTWGKGLYRHYKVSYILTYTYLPVEVDGELMTKLYVNRNDFSFNQLSFHLLQHSFSTCMWSFQLQVKCFASVGHNYADLLYCLRLSTVWLLEQGYVATRLKKLEQLYGCHERRIIMVYSSAPWEPICSPIVFLPLSFTSYMTFSEQFSRCI